MRSLKSSVKELDFYSGDSGAPVASLLVLKETNPLEQKAESVHNMGEGECCFMEEVPAERLFPFA